MSDTLTYLVGNRWIKDAEGEFISVEDSYAVPPVSLSVDGKSTQVTTTGKNLWDDSRYASVGWTNVTGSLYRGGIKAFCDGITDLGNGNYPENTQVTICLDIVRGGSTGTIRLRFEYTDGSYSATGNIGGTSYHRTYTSTAGKTVSAARITTTAGSTNNNFYFGHLQVGVGVDPSAYEPYSGGKASPSPDYPQQIISVDDLPIMMVAKNLLDSSSIEQGSTGAGENFESLTRCRTTNRMPIRAGSSVVLTGTSSSGNLEYLLMFYKSGIFEVNSGSWVTPGQVLAVPSNVNECRIVFRNSDDSNIAPSDLSNIQLEYSSIATPYQPYSGNVIQLLPDGYSLRSTPDGAKDKLYLTYLKLSERSGWAWYERDFAKRIEELDLGTLTWTVSVQTDGYVRARCPLSIIPSTWFSKNAYMCSAYETASARGGSTLLNVNTICTYATNHAIFVKDARWTSETTAEQVKEDLNGVMFYYHTSSPTHITLDPIELPTMQSGLTNVWSDPSTNLSITYERDKNIVISNIKATIDDLATS